MFSNRVFSRSNRALEPLNGLDSTFRLVKDIPLFEPCPTYSATEAALLQNSPLRSIQVQANCWRGRTMVNALGKPESQDK